MEIKIKKSVKYLINNIGSFRYGGGGGWGGMLHVLWQSF